MRPWNLRYIPAHWIFYFLLQTIFFFLGFIICGCLGANEREYKLNHELASQHWKPYVRKVLHRILEFLDWIIEIQWDSFNNSIVLGSEMKLLPHNAIYAICVYVAKYLNVGIMHRILLRLQSFHGNIIPSLFFWATLLFFSQKCICRFLN